MTARVSCPFCNASVELAEIPESGRVPCSRCGETFSFKLPADTLPPTSVNGPPPPPPATRPSANSPPEVAKTFAPLMMLGLVLAGVVLGGGLYAIFRPGPPGNSEPTSPTSGKPPAIFPPSAVPALAYLPPETNVAFAVQPGPMLVYAERARIEPQKLLANAGVPERALVNLTQLGLTIESIEQLAGGAVIDDKLPLKIVVVLVLRKPHPNEEAFLRAMKATKPADTRVPGHHRIEIAGIPGDLVKSGDRTYVAFLAGAEPSDLESAAKKSPGSAVVPLPLKESLTHLSPASVAWFATGQESWAEKPSVKMAAGFLKQPDLPKRFADVRAIAAGVALEPDPTGHIAIRGKDKESEQKLRENLEKSLGEKANFSREGDWLSASIPLEIPK